MNEVEISIVSSPHFEKSYVEGRIGRFIGFILSEEKKGDFAVTLCSLNEDAPEVFDEGRNEPRLQVSPQEFIEAVNRGVRALKRLNGEPVTDANMP